MIPEEKETLARLSENSRYSAGVMQAAISHCFKVFAPHFRGHRLLELGPAEGIMTALLVDTEKHITVVEGSALFCQNLQRQMFRQQQVTPAPGHAVVCGFAEFDDHVLRRNIRVCIDSELGLLATRR